MRFACAAALLCALTATAVAAPTAADAAFEHGRTALAAGKFDEACAAFEQSLSLDFQYGTLFNLADCNDKRGKLATSLAMWKRIANDDHNAGRAQRARELAAGLEKRVPRLQITLAPFVTGAHVTIDGQDIESIAAPVPVDLGSHEVVVAIPDRPELRQTVKTVREGAVTPVTITTTLPAPPPDNQPPPPVEIAAPHGGGRATGGKVLMGLGGASVATGLVFGVLAMRGWSDAEDTAKTDVGTANDDVSHVRLYGNLSTALVVVGAVSVGVGVYLWRSGTRQVRATMAVRGDRASLALLVRF